MSLARHRDAVLALWTVALLLSGWLDAVGFHKRGMAYATWALALAVVVARIARPPTVDRLCLGGAVLVVGLLSIVAYHRGSRRRA